MAIKKKYNTLGRGLDVLISTEPVMTAGSGSILNAGKEYGSRRYIPDEVFDDIAAFIDKY